MARKKQYNEDEVLEKAMRLFWKNGYETTSMKMLEKEMGINKFSIYASFGNKHGLFLESIKFYKKKTKDLFINLRNKNNGIDDIKQFFYDSVAINQQEGNHKGCFVTNTYNEFAENDDLVIKEQMTQFMDSLKEIFIEKLSLDASKDEATVLKQANYLVLAKHGLAAATRVNNKDFFYTKTKQSFSNI